MSRGGTLLEVLVAVTILALAVVALMQLSSQSLRLLQRADDYQRAVMLAERIARTTSIAAEGVEAGQDGRFQWERRVRLVPVPEALVPNPHQGPRLYALSVAVRWERGRALEVASLRTVAEPSE